jgi:CheY-like chemotaxis protein
MGLFWYRDHMDSHGQQYSVLIVDDVPAVRESLQWLLEDQKDFTVAGMASDGQEAIERVRELSPQVVILDIELAGLDGYTVARQIKSLPDPPIVIFLIIHADRASRERSQQAGGDGFVAKSDGWPELIEKIHTGLKNKERR